MSQNKVNSLVFVYKDSYCLSKLTQDILIFNDLLLSLVNLRKKCALDCCTITKLKEINHNSPIA